MAKQLILKESVPKKAVSEPTVSDKAAPEKAVQEESFSSVTADTDEIDDLARMASQQALSEYESDTQVSLPDKAAVAGEVSDGARELMDRGLAAAGTYGAISMLTKDKRMAVAGAVLTQVSGIGNKMSSILRTTGNLFDEGAVKDSFLSVADHLEPKREAVAEVSPVSPEQRESGKDAVVPLSAEERRARRLADLPVREAETETDLEFSS